MNAKIANRLNLSIDELINILKCDMNDTWRNGIGEHERYDEVIGLMTGCDMSFSTVITDDIINNFLNE